MNQPADPAPPRRPRPGGSVLWPILTIPPAALIIFVIALARGMQTAPGDNDFLVAAIAQWAIIGLVLTGLVALFVRSLRRPSALAAAGALVAMFAIDSLYP